MKVGYARTSTVEQLAGFEAQLRDLAAAGCERIFREQLSSVDAKRAQLDAALDFVREGDALTVTKIDRLARSVANLLDIERQLAGKGVALSILNPAMDTSTPAGRLIFNILGSIAQFEREIMLERQKEGVQRAKAEGKYKGRAPTARARAAEIQALLAESRGVTEVGRLTGVSRRSIYRIIKENQ